MSEQAPAKRPRGRPRKHPPAPPPEPKLDPRRFAAAYAAHLMVHGGYGPTQASKIAAYVFLPEFELLEHEFEGTVREYSDDHLDKKRKLPPRRLNAKARLQSSVLELPHINLEGRSIRASLKRIKADPAKAAWLHESLMLLAILFNKRDAQKSAFTDEAVWRVIGATMEKLGWSGILPKLAAGITIPDPATEQKN